MCDEVFLVGQMSKLNELEGFGKKIYPWKIVEGFFSNNKLKGFGRVINSNGDYLVGNFKDDDEFYGWGYREVDGIVTKGLWEEDLALFS